VFKFAMVALIGGLALFISFYRPRTGSRILVFACSVTAFVVFYSLYLHRSIVVASEDPVEDIAALDRENFSLDLEARKAYYFRTTLHQLAAAVARGRTPLVDAVNVLSNYDRPADPPWLQHYRQNFPGRSNREYCAVQIIREALALLEQGSPQEKQLSAMLQSNYQTLFGEDIALDLARKTNEPVFCLARKG
jgi:hypothetical protein